MPVKLHSFQMMLKTSLLSKFNTQRKVKYKVAMTSLNSFFFFGKTDGCPSWSQESFLSQQSVNLAFHMCIHELAHKEYFSKVAS